jgi:hypothetical protein
VRKAMANSRACSSFSLTSRWLFTKDLFWQAEHQFHILLWHFMATVWKCVKASSWNLLTKELDVAQDNALSHSSYFTCWILYQNMYRLRFEVFTAVTTKNGVFWDVMPCGSCKKRRFGGT